jgi:hypothetical protein
LLVRLFWKKPVYFDIQVFQVVVRMWMAMMLVSDKSSELESCRNGSTFLIQRSDELVVGSDVLVFCGCLSICFMREEVPPLSPVIRQPSKMLDNKVQWDTSLSDFLPGMSNRHCSQNDRYLDTVVDNSQRFPMFVSVPAHVRKICWQAIHR